MGSQESTQQKRTASEQKVIDDIAAYGWHCVHIVADDSGPAYSFTIGAWHSYRQPELLIMGLPHDPARQILALAIEALRSGDITDLNAPTSALLIGHDCVFVRVPETHYHEHVGYARWYYKGNDFPLYQIVWPSREGRLPWQAPADASYLAQQPLLGPAP